MHTHTPMHAYTQYAHTPAHMHMYMHIYIRMYARTYTYIHTRMHVHKVEALLFSFPFYGHLINHVAVTTGGDYTCIMLYNYAYYAVYGTSAVNLCMCVRACVRARVRVCVCVHACAYVCVCYTGTDGAVKLPHMALNYMYVIPYVE